MVSSLPPSLPPASASSAVSSPAAGGALPRLWALVLLLAAAAALMGALYGEFALGVAPCILCLYQRVPWVGIALVAALAFQPGLTPLWRRRILAGLTVVLLGAAGLAFFHLGVEQHWWAGTEACHADTTTQAGGPASLRALQSALAAPETLGRPPCDSPGWRLFGLTFAGYNLIANLGLALGTLVVLAISRDRRDRREPTGGGDRQSGRA